MHQPVTQRLMGPGWTAPDPVKSKYGPANKITEVGLDSLRLWWASPLPHPLWKEKPSGVK